MPSNFFGVFLAIPCFNYMLSHKLYACWTKIIWYRYLSIYLSSSTYPSIYIPTHPSIHPSIHGIHFQFWTYQVTSPPKAPGGVSFWVSRLPGAQEPIAPGIDLINDTMKFPVFSPQNKTWWMFDKCQTMQLDVIVCVCVCDISSVAFTFESRLLKITLSFSYKKPSKPRFQNKWVRSIYILLHAQ